jgi:hypothetical protein
MEIRFLRFPGGGKILIGKANQMARLSFRHAAGQQVIQSQGEPLIL